MRKLLNTLVWVTLGLIFIVFAVANRHLVTVSLDPFNSSDPSLGFTLPLFGVIIAFTMAGVLAGGSATWLRQRRWRRAARQQEAEARQLRAQLAEQRGGTMMPERREPLRLAVPPAAGFGDSRRDKQSAAL
jgi:uncharacterized integral membrane protein